MCACIHSKVTRRETCALPCELLCVIKFFLNIFFYVVLFGKLLKARLFSKTKCREGKLWEQEQSEQALRGHLEGRATARGQRRARISPALAAARLILKQT